MFSSLRTRGLGITAAAAASGRQARGRFQVQFNDAHFGASTIGMKYGLARFWIGLSRVHYSTIATPASRSAELVLRYTTPVHFLTTN